MIVPLMLVAMFLTGFAPLLGQRPVEPLAEATLYARVLQSMPAEYADRAVLIDPLVASRPLAEAGPMGLWERDLAAAVPSRGLNALLAAEPGRRVCRAEPDVLRCVQSAQDVYVLFGKPVVTESGVTLDVTFAGRSSESGPTFGIGTWRYTFSGAGLAESDREMVVRGHGRFAAPR